MAKKKAVARKEVIRDPLPEKEPKKPTGVTQVPDKNKPAKPRVPQEISNMSQAANVRSIDHARYLDLKPKMMAHRKKELQARLNNTSSTYPSDTRKAFRMELRAITRQEEAGDKGKREQWWPGWRLPPEKTRIQKFLEDEL